MIGMPSAPKSLMIHPSISSGNLHTGLSIKAEFQHNFPTRPTQHFPTTSEMSILTKCSQLISSRCLLKSGWKTRLKSEMMNIKFNSAGRNVMDFDAYRLTQMVAAITLPLVSTSKSDKNMKIYSKTSKIKQLFFNFQTSVETKKIYSKQHSPSAKRNHMF